MENSFHFKCQKLSCYICGNKLEIMKTMKLNSDKKLHLAILENFSDIQLNKTKRKNINVPAIRSNWHNIFEEPLPDTLDPIFVCTKKCKNLVLNHKHKQTLIKTKNDYTSRAFTKHSNLGCFHEHFDCQICSNFKIQEPPKNDSQKEYKWCSTDQDLKDSII